MILKKDFETIKGNIIGQKTQNITIFLIISFFVFALIASHIASADGTPYAPPSGSGGGSDSVTNCYSTCTLTTTHSKILATSKETLYISITLLQIDGDTAKIAVWSPIFSGIELKTKEYVLHKNEIRYLDDEYLSIEVLDIAPDYITFRLIELNPVSCEDTDLGINGYIKGTVTVLLENGEKIVKTDSCSYPDGEHLMEYACGSNNRFSIARIAKSCSDGVYKYNLDGRVDIEAESGGRYTASDVAIVTAIVSFDAALDVDTAKVEVSDLKVREYQVSDSGIRDLIREDTMKVENKTLSRKNCVTSNKVRSCVYEWKYKIPEITVEKGGDRSFKVVVLASINGEEAGDSTYFEVKYDAKDASPKITKYGMSPEKPNVNELFNIEAAAEDDIGIESIEYLQNTYVPGSMSSGKKMCSGEKTCTMTWNTSRKVAQDYELILIVKDTTGHSVDKKVTLKVTNAAESEKVEAKTSDNYANDSPDILNNGLITPQKIQEENKSTISVSSASENNQDSNDSEETPFVLTVLSEKRGVLKMASISAEYSGDMEVKESKLFMNTPAGKKQITIMPDDAVKISEITNKGIVKKIELKEMTQVPAYAINGVKEVRLFYIIPILMDTETNINAETGVIISVNNPWWSIFAK